MIIDNQGLDNFRKDFDRVKQELEEKYDVTVSLGPITYTNQQFTAKLTVDNSRNPEIIERDRFDQEVWKYEDVGLQPGMYKQVFVGRDHELYAIMGFIPNAKKYTYRVIRIKDGKEFRAPRNFIVSIRQEKYEKNLSD